MPLPSHTSPQLHPILVGTFVCREEEEEEGMEEWEAAGQVDSEKAETWHAFAPAVACRHGQAGRQQ